MGSAFLPKGMILTSVPRCHPIRRGREWPSASMQARRSTVTWIFCVSWCSENDSPMIRLRDINFDIYTITDEYNPALSISGHHRRTILNIGSHPDLLKLDCSRDDKAPGSWEFVVNDDGEKWRRMVSVGNVLHTELGPVSHLQVASWTPFQDSKNDES